MHGLTVEELTSAVVGATKGSDHSAYHVTLAVSTRCNLRCPYCFQQTFGQGKSPGRIAAGDLDQPGVLAAIEQFVSARMSDVGVNQVDLLLYGGEPLLRPRACLDAVSRFRSIGLGRCDMTTNGVGIRRSLFSELVDVGLTDTQVSLDGWKTAHDMTRSSKGGRPTYDRIIANIESCNDLGVRWQFRINMTPENLPTLDAVIRDLAAVTKQGTSQIMLAPVLGLKGTFYGTVKADAALAEKVLALYDVAIVSGLGIPIPGDSRACVDCGSPWGKTGAVIGPDGKLYSCWETIGRPEFSVGNVWSGYMENIPGMKSRWVTCGTLSDNSADKSTYEDLVAIGRLNLLKATGALGVNVGAG